jgi:hypothetical protein
MALVLIKETGAGIANANSYANVADGDSYHEGHLYATKWTAAITGTKEAALVMATRCIDFSMMFNGAKTNLNQGLQWPRLGAIDPDADEVYVPNLSLQRSNYQPENAIPKLLRDATCELARKLIEGDRTANPQGEGIRRVKLDGVVEVEFDKSDRVDVIPREVFLMLSKWGREIGKSCSVKLIRT